MQILAEESIKKFKLLRIRMKISFSAFEKNMTINELFYRTILSSYNNLMKEGKIKDPWPVL